MPRTARIRISRPALLIAFFVRAGASAGPEDGALRLLRARWRACELAGMTADIPGLGVPMTFPASITGVDGYKVMAACRAPEEPTPDQVRQAFLFSERDLAGMVALLAPNSSRTVPTRWENLLGTWRQHVARAELEEFGSSRRPGWDWRVLGDVLVCTGLHRPLPRPSLDRLCQAVRDTVPDRPPGQWWRAYHQTQEGFVIWEASARPPERDPARTICILAPEPREVELDEWIWSDGTARLMPFARYLLHAAKLGYQARVHRQGTASLAEVSDEVDAARQHLDQLLERFQDRPDARTLGLLVDARAALRRAQSHTTDLVVASTQLRELRQTVLSVETNLRALVPSAVRRGAGTTLFERDHGLAKWLLEQTASDLAYLNALGERSGLLLDEADTRVQEGVRISQERLAILQTSLVTALLTGLTATQALELTVPVPRSLRLPLVALLSALALAIPMLVIQGSAIPTALRPVAGYYAGVAGLGAAVGWLGSNVAWWLAERQVTPWAVTVAATAAGAALAVLVACLAGRHGNRTPGRRRRREATNR